ADSWMELPKAPLNAKTLTAYGIWYNGGTSYTIAGGYSDPGSTGLDQHSYLVHWDSATQTARDWTSYDFRNGHTRVLISHFDGIYAHRDGKCFIVCGDDTRVVHIILSLLGGPRKTAESRRVKYCGTLILAVLFASLALSEDFRTTNGKVYKNATVSRIEGDGIVLRTEAGISKVYFAELPQEVQERFHWAKPEAPREPFYGRWAAAAEDPAVLARI